MFVSAVDSATKSVVLKLSALLYAGIQLFVSAVDSATKRLLLKLMTSCTQLFVSGVDWSTKSLLLELGYFPSVNAFVCISNTEEPRSLLLNLFLQNYFVSLKAEAIKMFKSPFGSNEIHSG